MLRNSQSTTNKPNIPESVSITGMRDFGINGVDSEEKTYERRGPLVIPASAISNTTMFLPDSERQFNDNYSTINNNNDFDNQFGVEDKQIMP